MGVSPIGEVLTSFIIGLLASFIGAIVGGASTVSIPALVALGVAPPVAIATNKLGDLGRFAVTSYVFVRNRKVCWNQFALIGPLSIVGGLVGSRALRLVEGIAVERVLAASVVLITVFALWPAGAAIPRKGRIGTRVIGVILILPLLIYGGSFQIGSGPLILYAGVLFFGMTPIESNATMSLAWLTITVTALGSLRSQGIVRWDLGFPLAIGSIAGGYAGARAALVFNHRALGKTLVLMVFVVVIRWLL